MTPVEVCNLKSAIEILMAKFCCQGCISFLFSSPEPEMPVVGLGMFPDCLLGQAGAELAPNIYSYEISPNTIPASFYIKSIELSSWRATVLRSIAPTLIKTHLHIISSNTEDICCVFEIAPYTLIHCSLH